MKAFYLLLPLLMINSCKTTTNSNSVSETKTTTETMHVEANEGCPEEGVCTAEVQKGKKLIIKEDGTGALYPEITSGDAMVVIYTFSQKGPEGTVDGDYSETIHFEIPPNSSDLNKKDDGLQDVALLYGKQCYCKGEAGFYKVDNGVLHITKNKNELQFDLEFKVSETSHKISEISRTIKL